MLKKTRIAVLVSGGGTNLQALLDAQQSGIIQSGEIALVIASNPQAYALKRAEAAGVPGAVAWKAELGSQEAFEAKISQLLKDNRIDLIILAGFLSILSQDFTSQWPNRMINIHPSLIPSFCGAEAHPHVSSDVAAPATMPVMKSRLFILSRLSDIPIGLHLSNPRSQEAEGPGETRKCSRPGRDSPSAHEAHRRLQSRIRGTDIPC